MAWANLITGILLTNFATTSEVVAAQLQWDADDSAKLKITVINDMAVIGLMLGCLLAGKFLPIGRRRTILLATVITIIGSALCLIFNFWCIVIGKTVLGFGCGLVIVGCSIYNRETLPAKTLSYMGTSVNFGIVFGLLVSTTIQNLMLPQKGDPDYLTSGAWRYPLGAPIVISGVSFLSWLLIFQYESIEFSVDQKNTKAALALIKRVYVFQRPEQADQALKEIKCMKAQERAEKTESPGYIEALVSPKYRLCSAYCIISALFN